MAIEASITEASATRTDHGGNFNLLRVAAGMAVVYGNGLILTGAPASAFWGAPFSRFALDLLFAISGFTVAGSWLRRPHLLAFVAGRLRRIMPGLALCVLVSAAIIGPLATHLPLRGYALNGMTLDYLSNIAFVEKLWLPGVFQGQQWVGTVNPMLWTLLPGLLFCLALPPIFLLPPRWRVWGIAAGAIALSLPLVKGAHFYHPRHIDILIELPFFIVGAALRHIQDRVKQLWRADVAMLLFAANWVSATWLGEWNLILEWVSLPYLVACFGRMDLPLLGGLGRWGNPGYGLYLYAFPIQQSVVALWPACPHPIMLCGALSLAAGYVSWHLVERPALDWTWHGSSLRRLSYPAP